MGLQALGSLSNPLTKIKPKFYFQHNLYAFWKNAHFQILHKFWKAISTFFKTHTRYENIKMHASKLRIHNRYMYNILSLSLSLSPSTLSISFPHSLFPISLPLPHLSLSLPSSSSIYLPPIFLSPFLFVSYFYIIDLGYVEKSHNF